MQESPFEMVKAAFGGVNQLSEATGIPRKRVRGWGAPVEQGGSGGRIPAKHQGEILRAARERGVALSAESLIDMRDPGPSVPEDVQ